MNALIASDSLFLIGLHAPIGWWLKDMNCGDRRLIIFVSGAMALGMIVLVGMLTFKSKAVPSELWMSLSGISTGLFGIFSQRSSQQQKVEEKNEKEI